MLVANVSNIAPAGGMGRLKRGKRHPEALVLN